MMNQQTTNSELRTINCSIYRGERGSLLVGLIIVMTLMAVMAGGIYQFTRNTSFSALFSNNQSRAYYIAESGGLFAVPLVKADPPGATTNLNGKTYTLPNIGKFTLAIDNDITHPSYTLINSTGVVSEGGWFEAKRQITYKILKTFSDPFNNQANFDKNWTIMSGSAKILNPGTGQSDGPALQMKESGGGTTDTALIGMNWVGNTTGAPNLLDWWNTNDSLLSYEIQVKVQVEAQGSKADHYIEGLSFRLGGNDNNSATPDTNNMYGVSFFRSIGRTDNQRPPWIDSLPNTWDVLMSTSFDKAFKNTTDVTDKFSSDSTNVTIFDASNDYIYLGHSTTFDKIEVNLANGANKDVKPKFYYSAGSGNWTEFSPTDNTGGFKFAGTNYINWSLPLAGWATDTQNGVASKYWIKIQRTQGGNLTPPTENTIKINGLRYIVFWKKVNNIISLIDYKLLSVAEGVLQSNGEILPYSTLVVNVQERYKTDANGNRIPDGTTWLRENLVTAYFQGPSAYPSIDKGGTIKWDPLSSNFQPMVWHSNTQPIIDSSLTSKDFGTIKPSEIGIHAYYDANSANDQFFKDFAIKLLSSGGGGTGDIQYY